MTSSPLVPGLSVAGLIAFAAVFPASAVDAAPQPTKETSEMVKLGKEIVHGRGLCFSCHRIGSEGEGSLGPDLAGVGAVAPTRVRGLSATEYLAQSLYDPDAYVVEGYAPSMAPADEAPMSLSEHDVLAVVAYLQSLGSGESGAESAPEQPEYFEARGTVLWSEPGRVYLNHEEIPGFMDAMAMGFDVRDPAIVNGIDSGTPVQFRVVVRGGSFYIDRLQPVERPDQCGAQR